MSEAIENMNITEKPYTFRRLEAVDVFPMFKIISKIGVNEFMACFDKQSLKDLINGSATSKNGQSASIVGLSVILEIANVIMGNVSKCEKEIFALLASVSGMKEADVRKMDFAPFAEMVIAFVKKEEFRDFIGVVSKLFK